MTFSFRPAQLDGVGLFIAIAGSSRTGKTYSALKLARGIAGPSGRIACIDTEGRRMSHYKNDFLNDKGEPFDVFNMASPFEPMRFVDGARAAQEAGYDVLVIDSFSLEWTGRGGVLQTFEDEFLKRNEAQKFSDTCWRIAKKDHKRMLDELMQLTIPIIFCLRAKENAAHLGGGWKVEQDARFLYEWTVALTLHPDTPGEPRFDLKDAKGKPLWKVQEQHRNLFPERRKISEEAGAALQSWRSTDSARSTTSVERREAEPTPEETADMLVSRCEAVETADEMARLRQDDWADKRVRWLQNEHPQLSARVMRAFREAQKRTQQPSFGPATEEVAA